jgi:predicted esterase
MWHSKKRARRCSLRAMSTTLIALHGFTQNGSIMRELLAPLAERLPNVTCEFPDGPNACSDTSVARMHQLLGGTPRPPHRCWFDATDDGREYRGFEETKAELAQRIERHGGGRTGGRTGLLGFSQGAICGASLAALSAHGRFPKLDFVVLVAGRTPRSDEIAPLLDTPLAIPSLHVWGERDPIAQGHVQQLVERFDPATRKSIAWPGPHIVPTRGPGADGIVQFIADHA